ARLYPAHPAGLAVRRYAADPPHRLDQLRARARVRAHLPSRRRRAGGHGAHGAQPRAHRGEHRARRAGVRRRIGPVQDLPRRPVRIRPSRDPRAPCRLGLAIRDRHPAAGASAGGARRACTTPRLAPARARAARDALSARPVPRLELHRARRALPGLSAAGAHAAAGAARRGGGGRAALAGRGQRRLLRAADLPAFRLAAPRGVESRRAQRRAAHQAVHRRGRGAALARLAAASRHGRPGAAPVAPRRLGSRRRARRRVLRPAASGRRDCARARRCPRRYLPAGARVVRIEMKNAAAHPLLPEARLATTRDLVLLCGSLALVVLPHATRAPWWLTLLTLCLFAWRIHYSVNGVPLPSRWLVLAVAGVAMLGVWVEYRTIFGRQPGIVLLMLFSGLKVLETRTHRDAAAAAFLGYFLIVTNFLYTQSIPTALVMALALFAITATLTGFSAPNRAPRANLRTAALLLAHGVPAAAALFLLFPRVQGPLWGLPQDAYSARTGLSETMAPGEISRLALSEAIAFRAEFEGTPPASQVRYWRGPVLWDFDGRTWSAGARSLGKFAPPGGASATYRYSVVLEPHNQSWLFPLEAPTSLPEESRYTADGMVLAAAPVRTRVRYEMSSVIAPRGALEEQPAQLARALRLPVGVNPRTLALAEELRLASRGDDEIVARAIGFLRRGSYAYTLEPPLLGQDSVDEFLFDFKAGFCEHFSSAFVFLMRAAGVPARVVTGYQGGELNPVDRIITVRQS